MKLYIVAEISALNELSANLNALWFGSGSDHSGVDSGTKSHSAHFNGRLPTVRAC